MYNIQVQVKLNTYFNLKKKYPPEQRKSGEVYLQPL